MEHPKVLEWLRRAEDLDRWGAPDVARVWRAAAEEIGVYEVHVGLEALTLEQASAESGYSAAHLGRLVSDGKLQNVGKKGSPLVRRGDLPKKPQRNPPTIRASREPDLVGRSMTKLMDL